MIIDQLSEKPIKENLDSQSCFVGVHTNEEGKKVIVLYPQSGLTEISERASKYAEKSKETAMEAINICKSSLYDGKKVSGNTINIPNEAFSYAKILSIEGLSHIENKTLIPSGLYVENNGDLFSIPEQIISLENYGHGAGEGYNNTIDFERGIYTERCSLFVPEKAINYNEHLTYFLNLGFDIPMERYDEYIKAIETIKCSHSELSFEYYEVVQSEGGTISCGALRVKLNGVVPSEEELQEFIDNQREAGTPVMICYGIPDPVEINISKLISNMHIYITSGTDISFDNGMGTMELYVPKENVASKKYVNQISANAIRGRLFGASVSAEDVSPIEHELDLKVRSKNILPKDYIGRTLSNNGITAVINSDGSVTANGTADENDGSFINLTPYKEWFITEETAMFSGSPQGLALGLNTTARMILETVQPNGSAAHNGSPTEVTPSYVTGVIPKGSIVKRVYLSTAAGYTMDNVTFYPQLEYGTAITEFSSPSVDIEGVNVTVSDGENTQTGTADADGNVSGLMSLAPSMTLVTDNAGAVIECAYNRDTNKVIEELTNAIISLGGNI